MPVSIDTMALLLIRTCCRRGSQPRQRWIEFQEQVEKLVKLDEKRKILQAAAGLGTARNVERSVDLLTALMLQVTQMFDPSVGVMFTQLPAELEGKRDTPPAQQALEFYTDFANPSKKTYTWNDDQSTRWTLSRGGVHSSLGTPISRTSRARAPKLNLGITACHRLRGTLSKHSQLLGMGGLEEIQECGRCLKLPQLLSSTRGE